PGHRSRRTRQGQEGRGLPGDAARGPRARARRQYGAPAPAPIAVPGRRHHRQGGVDPPVEPGAGRSQGRQADQGRFQDFVRRSQGADRQALWRRDCRKEITMAEDDKPAKPAKAEKAGADGGKPAKPAKAGDKARPDKAAKGEKGAPKGKGDQGGKAQPKAEKTARTPRPKDYKPRLKTHYEKVVREDMTKQFGYKNSLQIPRVEKVVLNMGIGEAVNDRKKDDSGTKDLATIAGQRPVV